MQYVHLGRAGVLVSRLGLGTMNLGMVTDAAESERILDGALDLGINLVDTADVYGVVDGDGITESLIGRWIAAEPSRRDRIVLATKLGVRTAEGPNDAGLSARHIRRACEASLRRLRTDHLDLYQMHHVDRETSWEEIWQAMEQLIREGKVLYVGSSNFAGWHVARAQSIAETRGCFGLASEQSVYNLANRTVELELIPACSALGIGVLAYAPLAGGVLGGRAAGVGVRRAAEEQRTLVARLRQRADRYDKFCTELGASPARVALAWLLRQPGVTAPIVGPRTFEQLVDAHAALAVALDDSARRELDEIWPGPGGPAPESYAW